jgi:Tol biopolymer transport system component
MASDDHSERGRDSFQGRVVGHYEIVEQLGRGGMGVVFRARDIHLGREVALKRPAPGYEASPDAHRRFLREARTAAKLSHANVVPIFEVFEEEDIPWLAMQLIDGQSLRQLLRDEGALRNEWVLQYGEQIAEALQAAHEMHILHRDVNPNNILISQTGQAFLADFGLARYFVPPGEVSTASTQTLGITQSGVRVGTPAYMSPEQYLGRDVDARSDVFSLGAVLYEMCTGRPAFSASNEGEMLDLILHRQPVPISKWSYEVPGELERIIRKALAKEVEERYQTVTDLLVDLRVLRRQHEHSLISGSHSGSSQGVSHGPLTRLRLRLHRAMALTPVRWLLLLVVGAGLVGLAFWLRTFLSNRDAIGEATMMALVTWPGTETGSRFSPDGQWVSFCANRTGHNTLWLRATSGGPFQEIFSQADNVTSHVWSPAGDEIALLSVRDDEAFLQFIPRFGGATTKSVKMDHKLRNAVLVRWVASSVYIDVPFDGFYRFAIDSGSFEKLIEARAEQGVRIDFDVCEHGEKVVFTTQRGGAMTVQVTDLRGGEIQQVTPTSYSVHRPRWMGPECRYVIGSSNRSGQTDLWRIPVAGAPSTRITFSRNEEYVEDATWDGSMLTFRENQDNVNLWVLEPGSPDPHAWQLTADHLHDSWPTVSSSTTLAFQRSRPVLGRGPMLYNSQILLAELEASELKRVRELVAEGGAPVLSPGQTYLAYVRKPERRGVELWMLEIESGHAWRVAERFRDPPLYMLPLDRANINSVWSTDEESFFFVAEAVSGVDEIRLARPQAQERGAEVLVSGEGASLSDLHLSWDEGALLYVRSWRGDSRRSEVASVDLKTRQNQAVYASDDDRSLICRGSLDDETVVVIRVRTNPDWTEDAEVLVVSLLGTTEPVSVMRDVFAGTARIDARTRTLYLTGDVDGSHNLFALNMDDGEVRQLTDNRIPGISFSGVEILPQGRLLYSRIENNENIWLIRFDN